MTEIIPMDRIRESALAEQTLIGLAQRIAVLTGRDYCGVWLHVILAKTMPPTVEWTGFCGQNGAKTGPSAEQMLCQFQNYEQLKRDRIADLRKQLAALEGTLLEPPVGSVPASPLSTDGDKRPQADTARAPFEPPRSGLNAAPGETLTGQ